MKILWVVNVPLPEASLLMQETPTPYGGWLVESSKRLSLEKDIELSIAFPSLKANRTNLLEGKRINYYPFKPVVNWNNKVIDGNPDFSDIFRRANPDIVNVYGTELPHVLNIVNYCKDKSIKVVLSIQGLVSVIAKHSLSGLPFSVIYGKTLRNLLRNDSVSGLKKIYEERGKFETLAIKNSNYIIGRTTWDKACASHINPEAKYFHCDEILRDKFYQFSWDITNCEKYSIFLSQGQYPIKGFHYMLEAIPLILKYFPKTKLIVSGKNRIKSDTFKDRALMTYYGKYIKKMIEKLNIKNNVNFVGEINEENMCEQLLKTHVFVCPSTIENSPNSLCEAMILGVPSVASYVGGIPDLIRDRIDGFLYQHDAPYMLAHYVCEIFGNKELALSFSKNAREKALLRHDISKNTNRLLDIYRSILL